MVAKKRGRPFNLPKRSAFKVKGQPGLTRYANVRPTYRVRSEGVEQRRTDYTSPSGQPTGGVMRSQRLLKSAPVGTRLKRTLEPTRHSAAGRSRLQRTAGAGAGGRSRLQGAKRRGPASRSRLRR